MLVFCTLGSVKLAPWNTAKVDVGTSTGNTGIKPISGAIALVVLSVSMT